VWNLPKFDNLGFAKYGLGAWEISGIVNYSSGYPFSVTTGSAAPWLGAGRDIGNLRLNVVPGTSPCAGCGNKDSWATTGYFNKAAYTSPLTVLGTFGNSGRNSLIGPSYFDTDMSLAKNFPFLHRAESKVQFRADFFNLFNNVNFNAPNTSLSSSQFTRVTSSQNARQIQLALRLSF